MPLRCYCQTRLLLRPDPIGGTADAHQTKNFMYPGHVHDLGSSFWNRAADTFRFKARYHISGPSIVATTLKTDPIRTLAAYAMKFPAQIEAALLTSGRKDRLWNLVGGWEVLLERE